LLTRDAFPARRRKIQGARVGLSDTTIRKGQNIHDDISRFVD